MANQFKHWEFAELLEKGYYARFIEGVPAIWDGDKYVVGIDGVYSEMLSIKKKLSIRQRKEVMEYLRLKAYKTSMGKPNLIAFANGVLDISSGNMVENTPDLNIPNIIPHTFNPGAYSEELDKALDSWSCGDPFTRQNLEEIFGLAMYRGREIVSCPVLIGEGGNGKSVFINFLRSMLGKENVCALDLHNVGERFAGPALMGKLANFGDDIAADFLRSKVWAPAKKAISGDELQAEIKYGSIFSFRPYCFFLFACNTFPAIDDRSNAILRRLIPIPFNADFSLEGGQCDLNLAERLDSEMAYQYAIKLGIQALKGCIERGGMSTTQEQENLRDELIYQSSPVYGFCQSVLSLGAADELDIEGYPTSLLYRRYLDYCKSQGQKDYLAPNPFTIEMCRLYGVTSAKKTADFPDGTRKQASVFVSVRSQVEALETGNQKSCI